MELSTCERCCHGIPIHQELGVSTIDRVAAAVASVWARHEAARARRLVAVEHASRDNEVENASLEVKSMSVAP
jgi:hypothetical protein